MEQLQGLNRISLQEVPSERVTGKYNAGYLAGSCIDYSESDVTGDWMGDEVLLWTPLQERTPRMETQKNVLQYHLARQGNAEVMETHGLEVPGTEVVEAGLRSDASTFLAMPYVEHTCYDQRDIQGENRRVSNPNVPTNPGDRGRLSFESRIESALDRFPGERLVEEGKLVNASSEGVLDAHNKNWGVKDGELWRFDIGEVPAAGPVWQGMPYRDPDEFYRETGIEHEAEKLLENSRDLEPDSELPEAYRTLMV